MLGTTLPTEQRLRIGSIIQVRPIYIREWKDKGLHYEWLDAAVIGPEPESRQPDLQDVIERIVEATEPLWRGEQEIISESISEDSYSKQDSQPRRAALQLHTSGQMTNQQLSSIKHRIEAAENEERSQLWTEAGFEQCKIPLKEISTRIASMTDTEATAYLDEHLERRMPQRIDWGEVVRRGKAHTKLRIEHADGHLIGWDLSTPGIAIQHASNGKISCCKNALAESAGSVRGLMLPYAPSCWMQIVTGAHKRIEIGAGIVGETDSAATIYELLASGMASYGIQNEDCHEYELTLSAEQLSGRWVAKRQADRWLFSRLATDAEKQEEK